MGGAFAPLLASGLPQGAFPLFSLFFYINTFFLNIIFFEKKIIALRARSREGRGASKKRVKRVETLPV